MSNSPLVSYTKISPNRTSPRNHKIDTITIHCVVGQVTVESLGEVFAPTSRQASSNYGIGKDGRIGMYVEEKDRSWCSSSSSNDNRAITIECASDLTSPYAINEKVYASLIDLCADICKRNGIPSLKWKNDKHLIGEVDKQNITVHRWFANTDCPGDYIYSHLGQIAADVNKKLGAEDKEDFTDGSRPDAKVPYLARVNIDNLYIRKGPGTNYETNGYTGKGAFTIIEESDGAGSEKGWGKLKSGAGWIALDYTEKVQ